MNLLRPALYYLRMARYFGAYVRMDPPEDPGGMVKAVATRRNENFLGLMLDGVFHNPRTPYYHLLRRSSPQQTA